MWTSLIIWLVKFAIERFLGSNIQLKKQLDDAVQRNKEFKEQLANLDKKNLEIAGSIVLVTGERNSLLDELDRIYLQIDDIKQEKTKALNEYKEGMDKLADAIVVRSEL